MHDKVEARGREAHAAIDGAAAQGKRRKCGRDMSKGTNLVCGVPVQSPTQSTQAHKVFLSHNILKTETKMKIVQKFHKNSLI